MDERLLFSADGAETLRLLRALPDGAVNQLRVDALNLLDLAISSKNVSAARVLLENGAITTPHSLVSAVATGSLKLCELLLDHGVPVNGWYEQDEMRVTALFRATCDDQVEIARLLFRRGADPNFPLPIMPLTCAVIRKNADMVRCLLEAGSDVQAQNMRHSNSGVVAHCSVLALAIDHYSPDVFEELLKENTGIDVNAPVRAGTGLTYLHCAVVFDKGVAIKSLLEKGANPSTLDSLSRTPFRLACERGDLDCIYELMRGNPADNLPLLRAVEVPKLEATRKRRRTK